VAVTTEAAIRTLDNERHWDILVAAVGGRQTDRTRQGLLVSTTMAMERASDIARWQRTGYAGVDMECAATTGVASHFWARDGRR
jgi:uridine phosphorylase